MPDLIPNLIFSERDDAEKVLRYMRTLVREFMFASVADLKELAGLPSEREDHHVGWTHLEEAVVNRDGNDWSINFPLPERFA